MAPRIDAKFGLFLRIITGFNAELICRKLE